MSRNSLTLITHPGNRWRWRGKRPVATTDLNHERMGSFRDAILLAPQGAEVQKRRVAAENMR